MTIAAGHAGQTIPSIRRFLPPAATAMFAACILFLSAAASMAAPDIPVLGMATPPVPAQCTTDRGIGASAAGRLLFEIIDHACLPADIQEAFRRGDAHGYARISPDNRVLWFLPRPIAFAPLGEPRSAYPVVVPATRLSRAPPSRMQ